MRFGLRENHTLHNAKKMEESHVVTSLIPAIERGLRRVSGSGISAAWAANAPGVTDTEIKIGQTMPYSGPASSALAWSVEPMRPISR